MKITYAQSQEAGFAWRANLLALEEARALLAEGDTTAAAERIEAALQLAEASLARAEREARDWRTRPPFAG